MPDDIRIEKISRFLGLYWPHFEFDSRSFNYSMPKQGSSWFIGGRNSMRSTDMKYQFNKIFLLLIKLTQNTVKPHFNSNLVFFWGGAGWRGG